MKEITLHHRPSDTWVVVRDGHVYDPNTMICLDGTDIANGALIWLQRNDA